MTKVQATAIGFIAIGLWALLALFTVGTAPVPPLQLNALCFAIGGSIGLVWLVLSGGLGQLKTIPLSVYAFGTAGLFGYHFIYFTALRLAPPAEASLIAYLWPLLIVVFSGLLPGEHLRKLHVLGAAIAFVGAAMIVLRGGQAGGIGGASALPGYALAFLCALIWSGYSLISRRLGAVPTAAVVVYCLATAVLSLGAHLAMEETRWPTAPLGWLAVIGLGVGPVGIAFFTWDIGVKKGDIQLLGTTSYAAPLLSTLAMIAAGATAASPILVLAAALITAGALVAAWASRPR
ncbi:aromatic amino acid exporter YddG [Paenirhodobacter enshiensis]|uniref:Membrane protein n=1 Tax=Paenirhodobacter enshiensis TaxID=1105367 RepID=A0A086XSL6_9RHOB|nr:EamA family transporter [Paenirhodobacter enshiensis]KFI25016.1 membrane protein [Paenirhodobacter enshiensis]